MKRILSLLALTILVAASCSKYDDTELRNKVNGYESRIAALEALSSYKDLLGKLSAGKTVTGFSQSGNEITLTFSDGSTVKFNQQGPKGDPGESIKGDPGDPGDPGSPGQDGVTPQFKIEGENWMVSYDEGKTWKSAGSAIDRSLIKDIKVEGDVLKLTLADGTVVPVTYGEKEKYSITVGGGRKCFSCFEKEEWLKTMRLEIPYTLTGDIENADDVKLTYMTTIPFDYSGVSFIPSDAKSGIIRVPLPQYNYEETDEVGWYGYMDDDRTLNASWSGGWLEILAFFPDGTTGYHKLYIASCFIELNPDYDNDIVTAYDWPKHVPFVDVPSNAVTANYYIRMGTVTNAAAPFDGELFTSLTPSNYLEWVHRSGSNFVHISFGQSELINSYSPTVHVLKIPCVITCTKNNTGSVRTETIEINRKLINQSPTNVFRVRFDQAK